MLHACPSGLRGLTQDQVLFQLVSSNLTACKKFLFCFPNLQTQLNSTLKIIIYFLDIFNVIIVYSNLNDICFINAFLI